MVEIKRTLVKANTDAFLMQNFGKHSILFKQRLFAINRSIVQPPIILSDMKWSCYQLSNGGVYISFESNELLRLQRFCHTTTPYVNSETVSIIAFMINLDNHNKVNQSSGKTFKLYNSLLDYTMQYSKERNIIFEALR